MNIFEQATKIESEAKTSMKGSRVALADTLVMPYFKGTMRRKVEGYTPVVKGNMPLTGAFLMNYFTCLAFDLCQQGYLDKKTKKQVYPALTVYLVSALLTSTDCNEGIAGGFSEKEFCRKRKGFAEIGASLKAFAEKENLKITVDQKTGVISGITKEIACKVLSYF